MHKFYLLLLDSLKLSDGLVLFLLDSPPFRLYRLPSRPASLLEGEGLALIANLQLSLLNQLFYFVV